MTYQNDDRQDNQGDQGGQGGFQRQMFDVTDMGLTCAECGIAITELPFKPNSDRPVYCRECNRKRRRFSGGGGGGGRRPFSNNRGQRF